MTHNPSHNEYYDAIADGYNELHGEEQLAKYRIIARALREHFDIKDGARIIDVGAGTGIGAQIIWSVGTDPAPKLLAQHPHPESVVAPAEKLPFPDKSFDAALCVSAIHHANIEQAFSEIARVTKGPLAITVLRKSSKSSSIVAYLKSVMDIVADIEETKDIILIGKAKLTSRKD